MKDDKRSAVDVSRELIIDSVILTKEVLHAIQNNLPMPLDNVFLQRVDATAELEALTDARPNLRLLSLLVFFVAAAAVAMLV